MCVAHFLTSFFLEKGGSDRNFDVFSPASWTGRENGRENGRRRGLDSTHVHAKNIFFFLSCGPKKKVRAKMVGQEGGVFPPHSQEKKENIY